MSRVAVLGARDAVLGFKASGAVVFSASGLCEARVALEEIQKGDFAILLVTEEMARTLAAELTPMYEMPKPVVTIVPDANRPGGLGMELLQRRVERAVGVNILVKGEG